MKAISSQRKKYYIGLGCTFHDPAIAILDEEGNVLFAEATERNLQCKKASGIVCDEIKYTKNLLRKYCSDGSEFVISYSWSKQYLNKLFFQYLCGILKCKELALNYLFRGIQPYVLTGYDLIGLEYLQCGSISQAGHSFKKLLHSLSPGCSVKNVYHQHHLTHASYGCYTSPFDNALCVVLDGYGQNGSLGIYRFHENKIDCVFEQKNWASIGFVYALVTRLCGFDSFAGEQWKVMGLAPYGKLNTTFYSLLKSLIKVKDHSFKFTLYKKWINTLREISSTMNPNDLSFSESADLAYTGQLFFSEIMGELFNNIYKLGNTDNLIFTGGCALNSSFNGQILAKTRFKNLYIPPAPGDDGNALGTALLSFYKQNPCTQSLHKNHSPYLGSSINSQTLANFLKYSGIQKVKFLPGKICEIAASLLADGKLIGWVQGSAEFGPRALGNRSILADPRSKEMKDKINGTIKFREDFRPFAPAIIHEFGSEYFDDYVASPFMEKTFTFKKSVICKVPAVVHIDNTGRLQSVTKEMNPKFYNLIYYFYLQTEIPLLLNTSFNKMGKPIIHSVEDAISVFYSSGLDALIIDDYLIEK